MPRKKIPYMPNLSHHVYTRCIELKDHLKSDYMKAIMEDVINLARKKYIFEFNGYVIMPNHIHFYIRTVEDGAPIYRIMQYIKARFAERFNRKMGRCGPFWNERYKCTITEMTMDPFACCMNVHNYIGNNPVKKGLVADPRDYRYSSFRVYVDPVYKGRVPVDLHPYYKLLGKTPHERANKFIDIEQQYRKKNKYCKTDILSKDHKKRPYKNTG